MYINVVMIIGRQQMLHNHEILISIYICIYILYIEHLLSLCLKLGRKKWQIQYWNWLVIRFFYFCIREYKLFLLYRLPNKS